MPRTTRNHQPEPSRRDSWPPTQISLYHSIEDEDNDTKMTISHHQQHHHHHHHHHQHQHHHRCLAVDDDPINSFLTPTPLLEDGDTDDDIMDLDMDMDMAFDAGIEDPQRPSPAVRSISPSKLAGGLRPPLSPRTPTPPHLRSGSRSPPSRNSPEIATPSTDAGGADGYGDDDDDGEDYVRLTPQGFTLAAPPLTLRSFISHGSNKARETGKAAAVAAAKAREKEQDRVALAMVRGGYMPRTTVPTAADDDDDDDDDDVVVAGDNMYLTPSPSAYQYHHQSLHHHTNTSSSTSSGRPKMAPATRGRSTTSLRGRPTPTPLSRLPHRPGSWSGASDNMYYGSGGGGGGRLSPRAWREPSPDVWSIEEDAEGEVLSEMEGDAPDDSLRRAVKASKGKRVRFAAMREEIP